MSFAAPPAAARARASSRAIRHGLKTLAGCSARRLCPSRPRAAARAVRSSSLLAAASGGEPTDAPSQPEHPPERKARRANFYANSPLERAAHLRTDRAWLERAWQSPETRVLPMWGEAVAALGPSASERVAEPLSLPTDSPELDGISPHDPAVFFLGVDARTGALCVAVDFERAGRPPPYPPPAPPASRDPDHLPLSARREAGFYRLRTVGPLLSDEADAAILAYAAGMAAWARRSQFCSRCGSPAALESGGFVRSCTGPACGAKEFPRTDPAVIMLITCGEHCLLGRKAAWAPQRYSTLAGFVEPGESFEEAVARETLEESGVRVDPSRVRYHSSQPWPFPASLMVGFYGEVQFDGSLPAVEVDAEEMEDVRWFHADWLRARLSLATPSAGAEGGAWGEDHPDLDRFAVPGAQSLARRLILDWLLPGPRP